VPDPTAIEVIVGGASRVIEVADDACAEAIRLLYATTHNLAEPAGAIATAGLMAERDLLAGRRAATILCGGNLDAHLCIEILSGRTPHA
jgi:threonine dehydratase